MAKKRTLKLLSIVCAAAFFTGACGSGGGDASSDPSGSQQESAADGMASGQSDEKPSEESSESASNDQAADNGGLITITTVVSLSDAMQQYIGVKDDVQTNNSWYNGYEKDLGIHVENLWSVPGTQYQDKLNAQISAGDIPDVFNVSSSQLKTLVDNGMVMELTDLFEQNASDFTREMMEADDYTALEQCKMNGGLYAVGHWNEWFAGMVYMTDPANYPLQTYLQSIIVVRDTALLATASKETLEMMSTVSDRTLKSAQIFIAAAPILAVYPFVQKYFMKGLTVGSVKG